MKIAYLTNCFPSAVEPYVLEEIVALQANGIAVLASSARRAGRLPPNLKKWEVQTLYLQASHVRAIFRSIFLCAWRWRDLKPFLARIRNGHESLRQRAKAVVHTWLGVYYAALLENEEVEHVHVHHGYFSSWIAMVAARLLGISYSLTLHGSDLLVKAAYLDVKLEHCLVCGTISEYNRSVIFQRYPGIAREKILLRRMGVDVPPTVFPTPERVNNRFVMLAAGRLHPVKDYSFLIQACALLKKKGVDFVCFIAGDGPERKKIARQIHARGLAAQVKLLGHIAREDLAAIYPAIDLMVLTSRSEGIPLVLMEAMAHGRPVLAPRITGIPELVRDGTTGFLYEPGSLEDFVRRLELVRCSLHALDPLRRAARTHVRENFNRDVNTKLFIETLSAILARKANANPVLQ